MSPFSQTRSGGNVFGELVRTVEVCLVALVVPLKRDGSGPRRAEALREGRSLGQITACLTCVFGKFRRMV